MLTRPPVLVSVVLLAAACCAFPAAAQSPERTPEWWAFVSADPVRFSSLPLSFEEALAPAQGQWQTSFSIEYFNLWFGSWHTAVIHREFGLQGTPLNRWELRMLERRHPEDAIFRLDAEGWLGRLTVAHGLGHGLAAVIDVPWIQVGAPQWDAISEEFHKLFGLRVGDRADIARSQTLIYIRGADRSQSIEAWDELNGAGLGDVRLTVNGPLGGWLGGSHRWAVSLEAPTGSETTLRGSGGWDAGARWFGTWGWGKARIRLAAGFTKLAASGSFLGVERSNTWHALGEYVRPMGRSQTFMAGLSLHTSPIREFTDSEPGDPSLVLDLGWGFRVGRRHRLEIALAENVTGQGTAPDFVFHVRLVRSPAP